MKLASFHYKLMRYLVNNNYTSGLEFQKLYPDQKLRVEESLKYLYQQGMIAFTTATSDQIYFDTRDRETSKMENWGFDIHWHCRLTEIGHIFLEDHEQELEEA